MSWKEFETRPPRMASPGFEMLNRKVSYLQTLKKDGSPNLHPITPFIGNDMLLMFTEPSSPKINDLCSDGRYALHCSLDRQKDEPLKEFLVTGTAKFITDREVRSVSANIAASPVVAHDYVLFEFQVQKALAIEYDDEGKRFIQRWKQKK